MATKMMPPITPPAIAPAVDAALFDVEGVVTPLIVFRGTQVVLAQASHVFTEREQACPAGHVGQAGFCGGHATQLFRRRSLFRAAFASGVENGQ